MKIKNIIQGVQYMVLIALFMVSCSNDDNNVITPTQVQMTVLAEGPSIIQGKTLTHPQTSEVLEAGCFLMDLKNPSTNEVIGTLQDCVINDVFNEDGTITSRVISTINMYERGSIVVENQVLQTPTETEGILTTLFHPIENNIIDSSGEFEGMSGTVALDGEIDVTQFETGGIVVFNCTFTVDALLYN